MVICLNQFKINEEIEDSHCLIALDNYLKSNGISDFNCVEMYIQLLPTPSKLAQFREEFKKNLGNKDKLINCLFGLLVTGNS